jgi:hypothetical protein
MLLVLIGLLRTGKRQIMESDKQMVALGEGIHERTRIAVRPAQKMEHRLPPVQHDFSVQDFHRQSQFAEDLAAIMEEPLAPLLHPFR